MSLFGLVLHWAAEWPARRLSYTQLDERLQKTGRYVEQKMANAPDLPRNVEAAKHIVGIERWGQRRLRTTLGEALVMDEYDSYRPEALNSLPALTEQFRETRNDTRQLLKQLQDAGVALDDTIPHNELGPTTVRGWIIYLAQHASRDSMGIRPR